MKFNKIHISFSLVLIALLSAAGISQPQTSAYVYQDSEKNTSSFQQSDITKSFVFEEPGNYDLQTDQEEPGISPLFFSSNYELKTSQLPQKILKSKWSFLRDQKSTLEAQIFPFHFFS
ncbi:hypothetical protein SAMN04487907_101588 [Zunongwangia mangrovi]|uniref:Uncharacterized protein n=1 Tax=Zunongwangia mangrovi TaxID=1334022 RepID=A0A1I1DS98_9FLAO|nr:hypothetical protein [Zunongwangia mangrovi]SFB77724.1 hypothetical protein SAMN04487907_101588 [Zunongwangia mangrovi]